MAKIRLQLTRAFIAFTIWMLALSYTTTNLVLAEGSTPPATTTPTSVQAPVGAVVPTSTSPNQTGNGPKSPTGPDSSTYHFNSATGFWENDYYIWDPVTNQTKPKNPQTYSYNPQTGLWDTTSWVYDPAQSSYKPNVISSPIDPILQTIS